MSRVGTGATCVQGRGVACLKSLEIPCETAPPPSPQGTPAALPSPILCRMSSPQRYTACRRAARRSGGLPRRAGGVCRGGRQRF